MKVKLGNIKINMIKLGKSQNLERSVGSLRQPGLQLRKVLHVFVIGLNLKFLNFHPKYSIFHFAQEVSPENMVFHIFTSQKVRTNYLIHLRMTLEIFWDPSNERRHVVDDEEIGISDSALNQES